SCGGFGSTESRCSSAPMRPTRSTSRTPKTDHGGSSRGAGTPRAKMPLSMSGYIDLHCHFVPGIDDGARTAEEGVALLRALHEAGFARTIATPHMRPGLFENTATEITAAYDRMLPFIARATDVPQTAL